MSNQPQHGINNLHCPSSSATNPSMVISLHYANHGLSNKVNHQNLAQPREHCHISFIQYRKVSCGFQSSDIPAKNKQQRRKLQSEAWWVLLMRQTSPEHL